MDRGAIEAEGKRIRIHDLRHSHISLLIDMGFTALAIADRVGHESIVITYRYARLFPTRPAELADKLGDALDSIVSDLDTLVTALTSCHEDILAAMSRLRTSVDAAETLVNDRSWPLPKYREMLFIY